jgi:hypothetical protein
MKNQRNDTGEQRSGLTREGESDGAVYQAVKRVAEIRGVKLSDRNVRLGEITKQFFKKTYRRG